MEPSGIHPEHAPTDMGDIYPVDCNLDGVGNYPSKRVLETPFQRLRAITYPFSRILLQDLNVATGHGNKIFGTKNCQYM